LPDTSIAATRSADASSIEVVQQLFLALNEKQIEIAVGLFEEEFVLRDSGLNLEFRDKPRLAEFFQKQRDLFPEVLYELQTAHAITGVVVLEWTLRGFVHSGSYGHYVHKSRMEASGVTVVECNHEKITRWTDYYDSRASMRTPLVTYFAEYSEL
jgi:steroid delta-isomerase-like uncharacterized protein